MRNQDINLSQFTSIQIQYNIVFMDKYKVLHLNSKNKFHRYKLKEICLGKTLMLLVDHQFSIIHISIVSFFKKMIMNSYVSLLERIKFKSRKVINPLKFGLTSTVVISASHFEKSRGSNVGYYEKFDIYIA